MCYHKLKKSVYLYADRKSELLRKTADSIFGTKQFYSITFTLIKIHILKNIYKNSFIKRHKES